MTAAAYSASVDAAKSRPKQAALVLSIIVLAEAVAIFVVGLVATTLPRTFPDEAIYAELARSFGAHGRFEVVGTAFPVFTFGPLYPVLLVPLFKLAPTAHEAYLAARAMNALLFASAAVPIWMIARRLLRQQTALIVAAASVALPSSMYTTKLQTEGIAYPLAAWSVLAALRLTERCTLRRQFVLLACSFAAPLARFELIVVGPALALVCLAVDRGRLVDRARRLLPLGAGLVVFLSAASAVLLTSRGEPGSQSMHGLDIGELTLGRLVSTSFGALGALDLYCGIVPFAVLFIVAVSLRRGSAWTAAVADELRLVVAAAIGLGAALMFVGSVYLASIPSKAAPPVPAERYTFYVVPLILIAFGAWIEHGMPRPRGSMYVAAAAAALPVVVGIVELRSGVAANSNGLAFLPWAYFPWAYLHGAASHAWLVALAAYACFCVMTLARAKSIDAVVKPVVLTLALYFVYAYAFIAFPPLRLLPAGWIDAHAGQEVVALWTKTPTLRQGFALWNAGVTNNDLRRVYYLKSGDHFGRAFETRLTVGRDGRLLERGRPFSPRYVLTTHDARLAGTVVARGHGFALYQVDAPLRLIDSGS